MSLTKKQRKVALNLILGSLVVVVMGMLCYAIVNTIDQPAAATPNIRTVNTQRYEKINLGNGDGTVDHFCLGTSGIWYGPNSGDFSVESGDPLCR